MKRYKRITAVLTALAIMICCPFFSYAEDKESLTLGDTSHPIKKLSASSIRFGEIDLSWSCPDYDGIYTIYRVSGKKKIQVADTYDTSYTVTDLKAGKKYYFQVKSDVISKKVSCTVISTKSAKLTMITENDGSTRWDIRIAAGEQKYGYDTIQGACCYDGIAYFSLYNRKVERIKIAKVDLSTMEVIQVSQPLTSKCHGNTLTYVPENNTIVVSNGKGGKKSISIVDANTLKQIDKKSFSFSKKFCHQKFIGVSGFAYNTSNNKFYVKLRGSGNKVLSMDNNFSGAKYIPISGNRSYMLSQGIYSEGNYMYDIQSFKGKHKFNLITIRTVSGSLVGRIKVYSGTKGQLYELENIFKDETTGKWYASFYRANVKKSGDTDRKNYLYTIDNMWE